MRSDPRGARRRGTPVPLLLAALAAGAGCSSPGAPPPAEAPGTVKVPASQFPVGAAAGRYEDPAGPVTHVGRTVLPKCHKMVVGEVAAATPAAPGTEVVRIRETEVLWGPPEDDPAEAFRVLCGERGLAPRPGGSALFLLRLLPAGEYEALEVAPLDDADGPARLRAFRTYLRIEAVAEPGHRHALLRSYLRSALGAEDRWTRANAVREYAAYADAFPRTLGREDAVALSSAIPGLRDPELRRLAQRALDGAVAARDPAKPAGGAGPGTASGDALAPFVRRFESAGADARARADAVLEATARLDRDAEPLVARALGDGDPVVREAAAAAAGESGMAALGPRLLPIAATDESPGVRRTCVIALGHLRVAPAVPTLAGLARSDTAVAREAAFALARIRDDAATAALRGLRDGAPDETRRLLDFLLSDEFVRQERAMGAPWASGR